MKKKKRFPFLLIHELDIAKLYFSTNILIYQPDGSEARFTSESLMLNLHSSISKMLKEKQ